MNLIDVFHINEEKIHYIIQPYLIPIMHNQVCFSSAGNTVFLSTCVFVPNAGSRSYQVLTSRDCTE